MNILHFSENRPGGRTQPSFKQFPEVHQHAGRTSEEFHRSSWILTVCSGNYYAVVRQLNSTENNLHNDSERTWALERLHAKYYAAFATAPGCGVSRAPRLSKRRFHAAGIQDIPFDSPPIRSRVNSGVERPPAANEYETAHWAGSDDFLRQGDMGYIASKAMVAGFKPHAFQQMPQEFKKPPLSLTRLELVSLLKFDKPRVYVLDRLPRMDQLSSDDVPTRALTEFDLYSLESS